MKNSSAKFNYFSFVLMTPSQQTELEELQGQVTNMKSGIREIAHEINNPLGVLRMAAYLLETTTPDQEKRLHYVNLINTSIDRIEAGLKRLRALRDNPSMPVPSALDKKP